MQIFCKQPVKGNLHIFSFSWLKIRLFKILLNFFFKYLNWHFYYITGFCDKKFNFCKFANFFADSKSRAQELSNDVSFVIFGHQTWDLEGGQYPGFQVPQQSFSQGQDFLALDVSKRILDKSFLLFHQVRFFL